MHSVSFGNLAAASCEYMEVGRFDQGERKTSTFDDIANDEK